ncbi:MAG: methyltransferase domain-containing protein, partial [Bacteroidota bacterium]
IELGGRIAPKEGYETVDLRDADVCCDLNGDWPYPDSCAGVIRAYDIFEHLKDPIHTMKEAYRILAPGGWLIIQVPSTDGRGAFQDPLHVSFWNENSFTYYTKSEMATYIDEPVRFQAVRLYTTEKDATQVCWVRAHLVSLKEGYRPAGLIEI